MARPRAFDIDDALERAMQVFWAKGYASTSLMDLTEAMGIARGSFYKAFPDKHAVYLAVLDRYAETVVEPGARALIDPQGGPGLARIRRMLEAPGRAIPTGEHRRGCLMCNAAIDDAPNDPAVQARVMGMMRRLEEAIAGALDDDPATTTGSAAERTAAARHILDVYMGLRVLAKAGYGEAELDAVIDRTLAPLHARNRG